MRACGRRLIDDIFFFLPPSFERSTKLFAKRIHLARILAGIGAKSVCKGIAMDTVELFEEDDDFVMEAATDFISIASALVISRNETTNNTIGSFVSI